MLGVEAKSKGVSVLSMSQSVNSKGRILAASLVIKLQRYVGNKLEMLEKEKEKDIYIYISSCPLGGLELGGKYFPTMLSSRPSQIRGAMD